MKKVGLVFLFFYLFTSVSAQYTEVINSKRPGFSESPYGVGTKVLQVEMGGFYQYNSDFKNLIHSNKTFYTKDSYGGNMFLRYSNFLEKLEVNLDFTYQKDSRQFRNIFTSNQDSFSGISNLTLGAKYLVYNAKYKDKSKEIHSWKKRHAFDWSRAIPSVGVVIGWHTNYLNNKRFKKDMSFKGAILMQHEINERFVILSNLIIDDILLDNMTYSYILTSTLAVNESWSVFGEHQGVFNELNDSEYWFGAGVAFLVNNNIQIDISARTSLVNNDFSKVYASIGGSWRLDRHTDEKKEKMLEGTKEPFFKRIFKKKKKKQRLHTVKRKVKKRERKRGSNRGKKKRVKKSRKSKKGTPSFYKKEKKKKRRRKKED